MGAPQRCPVAAAAAARRAAQRDRGSVTPLVIGMVACLLLLSAAVIALGSAAGARADIRHACDGAVAFVADGHLATAAAVDVSATAAAYLAEHYPGATVGAELVGNTVTARCAARSPVAFGAIFGVPEIEVNTVVHARIRLR